MTEGVVCGGGDVGHKESDQFSGQAQRDAQWERVITCGAEIGPARQWHSTMPPVSEPQIFWYGDNLEVMREHVADDSVDLIYLDPPFNSQQVYNRFFGEADGVPSDAQRRAFEDHWRWGPEAEQAYSEVLHPRTRRHSVPAALSQTLEMFRGILHESNLLAYLSMMAVRMVEMRRVLKQTGTLYLHCDTTASHYLKILLDALFGQKNFQNEVVWRRTNARAASDQWSRLHDALLVYSKGDRPRFNPLLVPGAKAKMPHTLITGTDGKKYQTFELTGAGLRNGETGKPWHGFDPNTLGRHWGNPPKVLEEWHKAGLIHWPSNGGWPRRKAPEPFLPEDRMVAVGDVWDDIDRLNQTAKERVGYPTQKPLALLERIIAATTNEGDTVLDPFCGCGTAVVAAQKLKRKWIGIDITHIAVSVLRKRLESEFPGLVYRVRGEPEDVASARRLADEKWEEFQAWIVDKVGGIPLNPTNENKVAKKGKDGGIDGYFMFRDDPKAERSKRMILSVKAGKSLSPEMIDALQGVVTRNNVAAGVFLTAYPVTPGMRKTALAYGHYESELFAPGKRYPKIQIVTVEDIFDPKWRSLDYPGSNTSRRSEPPAGTGAAKAAGGDVLKRKPIRKGKTTPAEELEHFKLAAPEPKAATAKQHALKLPVPGSRGRK